MKRVLVIGAGLVGSVLSIFLAKRGYRVEVFERLPDFRKISLPPGRAINLTLCERGFNALDRVGVGEIVRKACVPVYGRLIHNIDGGLVFQPYGNNNEAIFCVKRGDLNNVLLDFAEQTCGVEFHFNKKCVSIDLAGAAIETEDLGSGAVDRYCGELLFGSDGAYSAVRQQLQKARRFNYSQQHWEQGYKELSVPACEADDWTRWKNVLHIWPRGNYMLIGFPNLDGSFTCSLHLPFEGEPSFDSIRDGSGVMNLFQAAFPDVTARMTNLVDDFFTGPPSSMVTIKCSPWVFQDRVALIGDAAHSIFPSYGQGANAGFEDCAVLDGLIDRYGEDWATILAEYEKQRKPNTDAIADLCVEHFIELRDLVGNPGFLLRKQIERKINQIYPEKYKDLYSMITFTSLPYTEAMKINQEQRRIADLVMQVKGIEDRLNSKEIEAMIDDLMRASQPSAPVRGPVRTQGVARP